MTPEQFVIVIGWLGYMAWCLTMCKFTLTEILEQLQKANRKE